MKVRKIKSIEEAEAIFKANGVLFKEDISDGDMNRIARMYGDTKNPVEDFIQYLRKAIINSDDMGVNLKVVLADKNKIEIKYKGSTFELIAKKK